MFDVVVVGARCAGSLTAMQLARRGHRVLVVDRSPCSRDVLCSHYLSPAGTAALDALGLLQRLAATGCPGADRTLVWIGPKVLDVIGPTYAPRRSVLDGLLVQAADAAGAEVREHFTVSDVVWDGDRVAGVVGHGPSGRCVVETARVVVGADGRRSAVADSVGSQRYLEREAIRCCYYAYWSGLAATAPELHLAYGRAVAVFPTHDELACVVAARPVREWGAFKRAPEPTYLAQLRSFPVVADRLATATRQSRLFGTADLGGCFRQPWGDGWALVGDAGHHGDPLLGGGMADALNQAALLADALDRGLAGRAPLAHALNAYHRRRDTAWRPVYDATWPLASLAWSPAAVPALVNRLAEAAAGTVMGSANGNGGRSPTRPAGRRRRLAPELGEPEVDDS